jgi:hypothetical protein
MAIEQKRAHVAANVTPVPPSLNFCHAHSSILLPVPDFWLSGTFFTKTANEVSTCRPVDKTFILYMTANEISTGLKKNHKIMIEFDNAQVGETKTISAYKVEKPLFAFSVKLPALDLSASLSLIDEPASDSHGILSRLLSRIQFESRIVLFDSFSWRSSASHVSLEDHATDADLVRPLGEEREAPLESGFPAPYAAPSPNGDLDAHGRKAG